MTEDKAEWLRLSVGWNEVYWRRLAELVGQNNKVIVVTQNLWMGDCCLQFVNVVQKWWLRDLQVGGAKCHVICSAIRYWPKTSQCNSGSNAFRQQRSTQLFGRKVPEI
jgi:hypothetical protein